MSNQFSFKKFIKPVSQRSIINVVYLDLNQQVTKSYDIPVDNRILKQHMKTYNGLNDCTQNLMINEGVSTQSKDENGILQLSVLGFDLPVNEI